MLELISLSNSFGVETKVKDIHDGCLLLMYRNHGRRSTSFEISNTCNDRTYNVTISVINARQYFLSRRTPFSILVQQRTVYFLLIVNRFKKTRRDFRLKVSHLVKYLKRYWAKSLLKVLYAPGGHMQNAWITLPFIAVYLFWVHWDIGFSSASWCHKRLLFDDDFG